MPSPSFDHGTHLLAVAQGDYQAFLSLYHHEAPRMLALGKKMLVRNIDAQDAVRDAFVLIWKHAESCDASTIPARAWIYSIFRHRVLSKLREPGRITPTTTSWTDNLPVHPGTSRSHCSVYDAILRLNAAQRRALLMAYYHGYTYRQIATHLGYSIDDVKRQIRGALNDMHSASQP